MADTYASRVAAGLAAGMSLTKLTLPEGVTSTGALALEEVLCERSLPSAAFALLQPQLRQWWEELGCPRERQSGATSRSWPTGRSFNLRPRQQHTIDA